MQHIISFKFLLKPTSKLHGEAPLEDYFCHFEAGYHVLLMEEESEQMSFKALLSCAWGFIGMPAGTKSSGRPQQFPFKGGWSPTEAADILSHLRRVLSLL